jgi:hypothetical protein
MLFNFQLCPFNQIPPWGKPGDRSLHWYGLSYGYYWLDAGGAELLRYTQAIVDLTALRYSNSIWPMGMSYGIPYVDYQVARLWEDVIDILPAVLEPVPRRLARTLGPAGQWDAWQRQAESVKATLPGDVLWLTFDACHWWKRRSLDTWYLRAAPDIYFWSDGADVHIEWDNRGLVLEGLPAWEAQVGEYRMPVSSFLDEVHAFDARFIRRMHDRVALAQVGWTRPEVTLDPGINRAHERNAKWLTKRMMAGVRREPDDWDAIFRAIESIEALMSASSPRLL